MAQSGSALAWGARGPGFKSRLPDQYKLGNRYIRNAVSDQFLWLTAEIHYFSLQFSIAIFIGDAIHVIVCIIYYGTQ